MPDDFLPEAGSAPGAEGAAPDPFSDTSRAEFTYRALMDALRDGVLRQGDRVREEEVGRLHGVSRTPVREAMRRLQALGLLEVAPGRGLVVRTLGRQDVTELYAFRMLLEGNAARLAAEHASAADARALGALLEEGDHATDPVQLARLNRRLHGAITAAARNRYLSQSLDNLNDALTLLPGTTFALSGRPAAAGAEHAVVVDAIARHDADGAEAAMRAHISAARSARFRMLFPG